MLKYLDMTNKQKKFKNIFNDSNISEIIWYYKFCKNNDDDDYKYKFVKILNEDLYYTKYFYNNDEVIQNDNNDVIRLKDNSIISKKEYNINSKLFIYLKCLCPYSINNFQLLKNTVKPYDKFKGVIIEIYDNLFCCSNPPLNVFKESIYFYIKNFTKETNYNKIKIKDCGKFLAKFLLSVFTLVDAEPYAKTEKFANITRYGACLEISYKMFLFDLNNSNSRKTLVKNIDLFYHKLIINDKNKFDMHYNYNALM